MLVMPAIRCCSLHGMPALAHLAMIFLGSHHASVVRPDGSPFFPFFWPLFLNARAVPCDCAEILGGRLPRAAKTIARERIRKALGKLRQTSVVFCQPLR